MNSPLDTAAIREMELACPATVIGLTTGDCTCVSAPLVEQLCDEIDRLRAELPGEYDEIEEAIRREMNEQP